MVLSHLTLFPPSEMKVRITSKEGVDHIADLSPDLTVDKVKITALTHFYSCEESMKSSLYHKLLHVRTGRVLNEDATLLTEGVKENDELLLLKRRIPPSPFETLDKREEKKGPDYETIKIITATLPRGRPTLPQEEPGPPVDFQTELRKILVSLIEASQRILCLNPSAAKIFKNAEEMLNEVEEAPAVDPQSLKQLTEMGFPENRAKKALLLNKMSVMLAMDWLLQHEGDPDLDSPVAEVPPAPLPAPDQGEAASGEETESDVPRVNNLLQKLRAFRQREFRPNPRSLRKLLEMGFEEQESVDALRIARNDQDAACEWLLGDRQLRPEAAEEGLDPSSAVYRAILGNPTVQLGLNNPKCLLAFLQMLENPLYANQWLNHPETGPILMQISRIYHAEKNSPPTPAPQTSSPSRSPVSQPPHTAASTTATESQLRPVLQLSTPASQNRLNPQPATPAGPGRTSQPPVHPTSQSRLGPQPATLTSPSRPSQQPTSPVSQNRPATAVQTQAPPVINGPELVAPEPRMPTSAARKVEGLPSGASRQRSRSDQQPR